MSVFNPGFPNVAYFIPDGDNLGQKIAIKYRTISESPQVYHQVIGGVSDIGEMGMVISTWKKLEVEANSKMSVNDILYSVQSIRAVVADQYSQGFTKAKNRTEYYIELV